MVGRVARGVVVATAFEVRLEDAVDDVVVVQRVNHVLEHAAPRLRRLAFGQGGHRFEDALVRPRVVARERPGVACLH
jgi:hypothetical protein